MSSILELYSEILLEVSPSISDDSTLDERLVKVFIHNTRALFARNELNKPHRTVDEGLVQDLGRVDLEVVDSFTDNPLDNISVKILKSKLRIPTPLDLHSKQAITYVGPLMRNGKGFKLVNSANMPYSGNGKFNRNFMYAFMMGGYLYITGNCNNPAFKGLQYVNVKGVFENPEDAAIFTSGDGKPCYSEDMRYPLPAYMWVYVKRSIIESDLKQFYIPLEDPSNNANNDINKFNLSGDNVHRRRQRKDEDEEADD